MPVLGDKGEERNATIKVCFSERGASSASAVYRKNMRRENQICKQGIHNQNVASLTTCPRPEPSSPKNSKKRHQSG